MDAKPNRSIQDFLENVWDSKAPSHAHTKLFRGQVSGFPLLPKLFRPPNTLGLVEKVEKKMLTTFKGVGPYMLPSKPANDWDWLSLGQHFGLPTRLTDWSESPLIALFFAVEFDILSPKHGPPVVFLYHASEEQTNAVDKKRESPFDIARTRVIKPMIHSARAEAQSAWHMVHRVHPRKDGTLRFLALDEMSDHQKKMRKFDIEIKATRDIRAELARMGMKHSTVYGDLQSVCRSIGFAFNVQ